MSKEIHSSSRYFILAAILFICLLIGIHYTYFIHTISSLTTNLALLKPPENPTYIEKAIAETNKNFKDFLISCTPILGVLTSAFVTLTMANFKS